LCAATAAVGEPIDADGFWPPHPRRYDPPGTEVAPGLTVGDILDQTNADLATDLLPPEILMHYETGGYKNRIVSWPRGIINYEKSFEKATRENEGQYDIVPETGTVIERATGTTPDYIYGIPFPSLSEDDPLAGIKALWNQAHVYWHQGSTHIEAALSWTNPQGVDRQSTQDFYFQFYENQVPQYRVPNPQNFAWQFVGITKDPADLAGTVTLSYRHRDPKNRDSLWTYIPALRRVRRLSSANRSDGFLGSDLSADDAHFFDGKPEDFVWKTVGLRDGLRMVDPDSISGQARRPRWGAPGGWHNDWPEDRPAAGYMKPGWQGLAWAPVSAALAKRRFWVVEGVPRDRYYLYGRVELWIDAESWIGAFNRKFLPTGELLNTYAVSSYLNYPAIREGSSEIEWVWASHHAWNCAENVKMRRATLSGIRARPGAPLVRRVRHNIRQLFGLQSLARFGK
jgi:hypothetical protein